MFAQTVRPKAKGKADVPAWAPLVPGFPEAVIKEFGVVDPGADGFAELDRWKEAVRTVHEMLIMGKKAIADIYGGQVVKLTRAVGLLRLCARSSPDHDHIDSEMAKHPYLTDKVFLNVEGVYDSEKLEDYINSLYG